MKPSAVVLASLAFAFAPTALAAPSAPELATVYVVCDDRQGSGVYTGVADGGYVLTVGHVAVDVDTMVAAEDCRVGFVTDDTRKPKAFHSATITRHIFDRRTDRDIAVLNVGPRLSPGNGSLPAPAPTSEFANVGDAVIVRGYPGGATTMQSSTGTITGYDRGTMQATAAITQGNSGGPAFDANGNLIGIAERVTYEIDEATGQKTVIDYEFEDILSVIGWLDSFGPAEHDKYLTHAEVARYHGAPYVLRDEGPGCAHVVRTIATPTVYCLLSGPYRLVFPNEATYQSWYADYSVIELITPENLTEYQLIGNVTMKAGSLVKIQTDPRTYLVTDSLGTLRWIPTEERAKGLFGDAWATLIRDVPDAFFTDYRVGEPIS